MASEAVGSCVIPAAGASSRMGDWKPLLPWGASTIVETVVASALEARLEVALVVGYRGEELRARFEGRPGIRIVENPRWEAGMLGSVRAGAEALAGEGGRGQAPDGAAPVPEAFFVTPADMPGIGPDLYRLLMERYAGELAARAAAAGRGAGAGPSLFAACEGRAGHPVLIPFGLLPAMRDLDPGAGLRPLLMAGPHLLVETGDPAVLADLDTAADYEAARALQARKSG